MALGESYVVRAKDNSGDSIAAFTDATGRFIQAMALVNEAGDQIAVSGNPLYISFSGDGTMVLSSDTIDALTSATSVTESILVDNNGARTGLSTNPLFVASSSAAGEFPVYAVIYDSNGKPARVDTATHTLQVISYHHHEIHAESFYYVDDWVDLNGAGATADFLFVTPNTTKWPHAQWTVAGEAEFTLTLYEGVSTSSDGARVTTRNANRNGTDNGSVTAYSAPILNSGTLGDESDGGEKIWSSKIGSGKNATIGRERGYELMGRQNTKYWFRIEKVGTGIHWVDYDFNWYEHTNKT